MSEENLHEDNWREVVESVMKGLSADKQAFLKCRLDGFNTRDVMRIDRGEGEDGALVWYPEVKWCPKIQGQCGYAWVIGNSPLGQRKCTTRSELKRALEEEIEKFLQYHFPDRLKQR